MNKKVLVLINHRNLLYQNARDRRILQAMLRLSAHFTRLPCLALQWGGQTRTWGDGFIYCHFGDVVCLNNYFHCHRVASSSPGDGALESVEISYDMDYRLDLSTVIAQQCMPPLLKQ
jgi:hypothetical protein